MSDYSFLDDYSVVELKNMQPVIERLIKTKEKQEKEDIRQKLASMAAESGYSIGDLFTEAPKSKRGPVKPKYFNPADPDQTWTGRGRQPVWVRELLESGKTLEDISL
jgi:DNA-binding protein H-NS